MKNNIFIICVIVVSLEELYDVFIKIKMVFLIQIKEKKMKKNFLMVASLLIAAMLMVVSCSQEVAPKTDNNGLVEARLNVGYARDLSVSGDTNTSNISLKYKMRPKWENAVGTTEVIYGKKESETPFEDNSVIGYVTPGLWEVEVFAYETAKDASSTAATSPIFTGKANVYFSNQNTKATVYLTPTSNQSNTLSFSITMQDLVGEGALTENKGNGSYKLVYTVYGTGNEVVKDNTEQQQSLDRIELSGTLQDSNNDNVNDSKLYEGSTTLASGFYRVNVSIYSLPENETDVKTQGKLVGGITKGLLLSGGKSATISGHIEPSDYEKVTIDAVYIDVKTTISETTQYKAAFGNDAAKAEVTFNVSTNGTSGNTSGAEISYIWYVAQNGTTEVTSTNKETYKVTFKAPGYKTVTCQTIYTVKDGNNGEYSFADTQSIRVYINPEKFGKTDPVVTTPEEQG